jgi:hypothetical protein
LTLGVIRRYSPDLMGLQEVGEPNIEYYRQHLIDYDFELGQKIGEEEDCGHSSIYWKKARFERMESGNFLFSRTPDVCSSDWEVPYPLGATWIRLQDKLTGAQMLHLNTQFEDGPWGEQSRQTNGFTDTYRAAGNADSVDSSTYHGYAGQQYFALEWGADVFWRVDWILTRDGTQHLQTSCSTIVRDAAPPMDPSDHSPVVSELVVL